MSSTTPSGNCVSHSLRPKSSSRMECRISAFAGAKIFATYAVNHHGDGRIALWLNTPEGMQDAHVHAEPKYFFVPPYVGPSGWLGVRLDAGLAWKRVAPIVRAAYERVGARQTEQPTRENAFDTRTEAEIHRRRCRSQEHAARKTTSREHAQDLPGSTRDVRRPAVRSAGVARGVRRFSRERIVMRNAGGWRSGWASMRNCS